MLQDGLSYPFKGDNGLGRILIGGVLVFFSFLILPIFLFYGYLVRVLGAAATDTESPPDFNEWGNMLVLGLKGFVVSLVYGFVPLVVMGIALGTAAGGFMSGGDAGSFLGSIGLLGFLVSGLAYAVVLYLVPAALTNMALEDSIGAAFDFSALKRTLLSFDYFLAWLMPFVVAFFAWIATIFLAFTVIGLLFVPFLQFYTQVVVFYMFGRAFSSSMPRSTSDPVGTIAD